MGPIMAPAAVTKQRWLTRFIKWAGDNFRVLELVTSKGLVEKIWQAIFAEAVKHRVKRLKSWESNILELAPAYALKSFFRSSRL